MVSFIAALYNEEAQVADLLKHILPLVDGVYLCDDGSTDNTFMVAHEFLDNSNIEFKYKLIEHTGLPETAKAQALAMVPRDDEWVLMLDADERYTEGTLREIMSFLDSRESSLYDYVYFDEFEFIDGRNTRNFIKCRLFRKRSAHFSDEVHRDDEFTGNGTHKFGWNVLHRKTKEQQIEKELRYLQTYQKLLSEGKITEERVREMTGFHYFVRPHG